MKTKTEYRRKTRKAGITREPSAAYIARRRMLSDVPQPSLLPGLAPLESNDNSTLLVETAFRRYGLEGEDVFLALAARCVQSSDSHERHFKHFPYERGLQIIDRVAHDRQVSALLSRMCDVRDAAYMLPVWYQYFLGRRFRELSGKFFTPRPVARSMAQLIPIREGSIICDPTCGGGTFLTEASALHPSLECTLVGNDVDKDLAGLTEAILSITARRGHSVEVHSSNVYDRSAFLDTLTGRVDAILANPPFSLPLEHVGISSALFASGYRNSDAVFIDICHHLLRDGGHLVCLLPHSLIANADYADFRAHVESAWDIRGVITLPEGTFHRTANTTTRADILHLSKKQPKRPFRGKSYFANAPSIGVALNSRDAEGIDNALERTVADVHTRVNGIGMS